MTHARIKVRITVNGARTSPTTVRYTADILHAGGAGCIKYITGRVGPTGPIWSAAEAFERARAWIARNAPLYELTGEVLVKHERREGGALLGWDVFQAE